MLKMSPQSSIFPVGCHTQNLRMRHEHLTILPSSATVRLEVSAVSEIKVHSEFLSFFAAIK